LKELQAEKKELEDHLEALTSGKKRKREEAESDDSDKEDNGEETKKKKRKLSDDPEKVKKAIKKVEERISNWLTKKTEKVLYHLIVECRFSHFILGRIENGFIDHIEDQLYRSSY
jgi:hypothetical protein